MAEIETPQAPTESPAMAAARELYGDDKPAGEETAADKVETKPEGDVITSAEKVEPVKPDEAKAEADAVAADPRLKTRMDIMARKKAKDLAEVEEKRTAFHDELAKARPVLDILSGLGPDAAKVIETARSLVASQGKDPAAILAAHGFADPMKVAESIIGQSMGDKAPPALMAKMVENKLLTEIQRLTNENKSLHERFDGWEKKQQRAGEMAQYRSILATVVEGIDPEVYPAIKAAGKLDELVARQEKHIEDHKEVLPDDELLEAYEEHLQQTLPPDYIAWKLKQPSPSVDSKTDTKTQAKSAGEKQAAKTLAGAKSPTRPKKEPETDEEIAEAAAALLAERRKARGENRRFSSGS